jgi:flagella basal body P-ring formation protein FlgA
VKEAEFALVDTVVVRDEVYVKGPKVLLGDVADIKGENAEALASVELATAALPGDSKRFDAALVLARIGNAGIDTESVAVTGARAVVANTLHLELTREMMAEDLRRFIEVEMPWNPQDTTVDVSPPAQDVVVPDGDVALVWRPNPQYRWAGAGSFRGEVRVDGEVKKTLHCRATIDAYTDVVVALEDIPRGAVISANHLDVEKRSVTSLPLGTFDFPEELLGYVARSTIFPGTVMTKRHVMPRKVVKRNQMVVVEARVGGLLVQTRARAMTDACEGDTLRCLNVDSKEEFIGTVRGDGIVILE